MQCRAGIRRVAVAERIVKKVELKMRDKKRNEIAEMVSQVSQCFTLFAESLYLFL